VSKARITPSSPKRWHGLQPLLQRWRANNRWSFATQSIHVDSALACRPRGAIAEGSTTPRQGGSVSRPASNDCQRRAPTLGPIHLPSPSA
jgi:hypothetical protein